MEISIIDYHARMLRLSWKDLLRCHKMASIMQELKNSRGPYPPDRFPPNPGIYAIYLKDHNALEPFRPNSDDGLIYIGKAENSLRQRLNNEHFKSKRTGYSALRRSIGAILKNNLTLTSYHRSMKYKNSEITHFKFYKDSGIEGEESLTVWMGQKLEIGICPIENPEQIENELIVKLKPILNLKGWPNPDRTKIKKLLKICVEEARLHRVLEYIKSEKRVCPLPDKWNDLWEMLPARQREGVEWNPALPLILTTWLDTSELDKKQRLEMHVRYAADKGVLKEVENFLRSLNPDQWKYEDHN